MLRGAAGPVQSQGHPGMARLRPNFWLAVSTDASTEPPHCSCRCQRPHSGLTCLAGLPQHGQPQRWLPGHSQQLSALPRELPHVQELGSRHARAAR